MACLSEKAIPQNSMCERLPENEKADMVEHPPERSSKSAYSSTSTPGCAEMPFT